MSSMELMTELLEAGVHFGHQTKRWNPKMKPFIFEQRNSIYIINLSETVKQLQVATDYLANVARQNGKVLFIGCKKQAQEAVKEAAVACGQYYVNPETVRYLNRLSDILWLFARYIETKSTERT